MRAEAWGCRPFGACWLDLIALQGPLVVVIGTWMLQEGGVARVSGGSSF